MTDSDHLALPNGWHLITHGGAQISVDPTGLIMFPRHATPEEVPDYCGALTSAADIAATIQTDNETTAADTTSKPLPRGAVILSEGPPPPGAHTLPQRNRATIGRQPPRQRTGR